MRTKQYPLVNRSSILALYNAVVCKNLSPMKCKWLMLVLITQMNGSQRWDRKPSNHTYSYWLLFLHLNVSKQLLYWSFKSVKTQLQCWRFKKPCATVTYIKVSRWHPTNADAFYMTTINFSLRRFNSKSLLLEVWQVIKTELHILQETQHASITVNSISLYIIAICSLNLPGYYMEPYCLPSYFCHLKLKTAILFTVTRNHKTILKWGSELQFSSALKLLYFRIREGNY